MLARILLLGEFSGLHTNLKDGLIELGHKVTLVSSGDGEKNINGDINIKASKNRIKDFMRYKKTFKEFKNYDVVQFINPYIGDKLLLLFYNSIFKKNEKIFCLAAGDDVEFLRFTLGNGMKKYSPFDNYVNNSKDKKIAYTRKVDKLFHRYFMDKIDGIIPVMWEYAEAYRTSIYKNKLLPTIPLPVNTNKITYSPNLVEDKINFYHSSKRSSFKGTPEILEAMKRFGEMYPNEVLMNNKPFMPLKEYLQVTREANVIIDQCKYYSYAMNALYMMAQGKIVMSGAEPEALEELNIGTTPVINITPDSNQILLQFKGILHNNNSLLEHGYESRKYVEKFHNHINIAKIYLETWNV